MWLKCAIRGGLHFRLSLCYEIGAYMNNSIVNQIHYGFNMNALLESCKFLHEAFHYVLMITLSKSKIKDDNIKNMGYKSTTMCL